MLLTEIFFSYRLIILLYIVNPITTSILVVFVFILGTIFYFIFRKNVNKLGVQRKTKEKIQNILQQGLSALKKLIFLKLKNSLLINIKMRP